MISFDHFKMKLHLSQLLIGCESNKSYFQTIKALCQQVFELGVDVENLFWNLK